MAKNKIVKKFNYKVLFLAIFAGVFMVVLGAAFSFITGYDANDNILIIQCLVWIIDIVISYSISWLIFTWGKRKIIFFDWIAWGLSILICMVIITFLLGTFEVAFISTVFSMIIPIIGGIITLLKKNTYTTKKKTKGRN